MPLVTKYTYRTSSFHNNCLEIIQSSSLKNSTVIFYYVFVVENDFVRFEYYNTICFFILRQIITEHFKIEYGKTKVLFPSSCFNNGRGCL